MYVTACITTRLEIRQQQSCIGIQILLQSLNSADHSVSDFCSVATGLQCRGWLGSRVVSVLDSGAEGPGSNRSRDAVW